ncbi:uncharacterized protein EV420DRAFT_1761852 [Desarmillaria tabescens]|uniref:Putative lipoate-protein ligase A n=1 Tax=Armillaria tabescens TaxID=1929756 RepID=A0AA39N9P0_ARMTA|nr:uncharacterized protein EV420DRAFT_1761852 [Desarmillaria tabescens]KAK0461616.1 hypothetical protein EV420DRAFT_1761852 [Desarmillaria tabescens]
MELVDCCVIEASSDNSGPWHRCHGPQADCQHGPTFALGIVMLSSSIVRRVTKRSVVLSRRLSSTFSIPRHSIYVSQSTDPYFNLSVEDWLFRHKAPQDPLLFLYRERPCVVIGRNQNPWKEINLTALRDRPSVPFVRRRSGGGTVYHDLGNTNYSIHLHRNSFDRSVTAQIILRAVRSLGVDAHVNDRNDICIEGKKISGSAYKIVKNRAYHHGTMLISTQLETLGELLRSKKDSMLTKGVASVPSPVCNLRQHDTNISHEQFCEAAISEFRRAYDVNEEVQHISETTDLVDLDDVHKGVTELSSWEWAYGQTPEFTYTKSVMFEWGNAAEIQSKHGIILESSIRVSNAAASLSDGLIEEIESMGASLKGQKYGSIRPETLASPGIGPKEEAQWWLHDMMWN